METMIQFTSEHHDWFGHCCFHMLSRVCDQAIPACSCHRNANGPAKGFCEQEISRDPDNLPPRSRLFIVVPKQSDAQQIQVSVISDNSPLPDLKPCHEHFTTWPAYVEQEQSASDLHLFIFFPAQA